VARVLQRIVPYLVSLLSDPSAAVRAHALRNLMNTLDAIEHFSPSDSKVFPEYIFPSLSLISRDHEELVGAPARPGAAKQRQAWCMCQPLSGCFSVLSTASRQGVHVEC